MPAVKKKSQKEKKLTNPATLQLKKKEEKLKPDRNYVKNELNNILKNGKC